MSLRLITNKSVILQPDVVAQICYPGTLETEAERFQIWAILQKPVLTDKNVIILFQYWHIEQR